MSKAQVNAHLKKFTSEQRKILITLRDEIAAEFPKAEQVIKYGIPTFLIEGVPVIGFDGYKNHNSIFPYSGSFNSRLAKELEKFEQTKGSIHFDLKKPFPKPLLKKILKEKILAINASYPKRTGEYLEFYSNGVLKAKGKYKADARSSSPNPHLAGSGRRLDSAAPVGRTATGRRLRPGRARSA